MREVRMTFGDHLEELRKRLIHSIFYLVVGISLTFIFGADLMVVTLGPHEKAIRNTLYTRLVTRLEKDVKVLTDLREGGRVVGADGEELQPADFDWTVLFAHDVAIPRLVESVRVAFDSAAALIQQAAFTDQQKAQLTQILSQVGQQLGQQIAGEFHPALARGRMTDAIERLDRVRELLLSLEREEQPSEAQILVGLARNLDVVTGPLEEFKEFLLARREEAKKATVDLAELKAKIATSPLPGFLDRTLTRLEDDTRTTRDPKSYRLNVTHYMENFMNYLKVALIFGLGFALPMILYEMWKFVGSGLHEWEQKYVVIFLPFSLALFLVGVFFGYFAMIPVGLQFLAGWGIEDVNLIFTLGNYIGLFFTLTLLMGLVFQVPLVMVFLATIDVVRVEGFRRARKIAIFVGFCGAAIITPPDPFTLLLMAGPLVLLYELGIIISQVVTMRRRRAEAKESAT